jgi:uncharacterized protein (DUF1015 family)
MANIKAFKAIHPNPFYADQLVFTNQQVEFVGGHEVDDKALTPLKTLLESDARRLPETPCGQELAYKEINDTFDDLLKQEKLFADKESAIYVYEVVHPTYCQVGIWAMTDLNDEIKTHELTICDSVQRIKNFRQNTGMEGSPILLTYEPNKVIDDIIRERKLSYPNATYESTTGIHKLWKIENPETISELVAAFAKIGQVYLADGHHRRRSADELAKEQEYQHLPIFGMISALYMSTDEIKIRQFNRVFIPDKPVKKEALFTHLLDHFYLHEAFNNRPIQPTEERRFGLYIDGMWYHLSAKAHTYGLDNGDDKLDVSILQNRLLQPFFEVDDPTTDCRLKHIGGVKAMVEMEQMFSIEPNAIGFTICPMNIYQLMCAANNGINLPPKSTWIDPKVPYGLLLYKHT